MPVKTFHQLVALGGLCLGLVLSEVSAQTQQKFADRLAEAQSQAEQGKKGLLLIFTGPAEDPASQRLNERVLSNERFRRAVSRILILLEIELPGENNARPGLEGYLADLVRDLGVNRLPSMHLVDEQLRPFGRIDYQGQDASACMKEIRSERALLVRRDGHFAMAKRMGGVPKARELDLALIILGIDINVNRYRDVLNTLFKLDKDGSLNIKRRYEMRLAWEELSADVPQLLHDGEWDDVRVHVDGFMKKHRGAAINIWKQQALYWKATAIMQDEGLMPAGDCLEEARAAAPQSALGKRIARMLKSMEAPKDASPEPNKLWSNR